MKTQIHSILKSGAALLCLFLVAGCGGGLVVPLDYTPVANQQRCEVDIGVQPLLDTRAQEQLGQTHRGGRYFPQGSVSQWASQALYKELAEMGCQQISYLGNGAAAPPTWVISGAVTQLAINQTGVFQFAGGLGLRLTLSRQGTKVFEKEYTINEKRTALPDSDVPPELVQSMLQDVFREAVPNLVRIIEQHRRP